MHILNGDRDRRDFLVVHNAGNGAWLANDGDDNRRPHFVFELCSRGPLRLFARSFGVDRRFDQSLEEASF